MSNETKDSPVETQIDVESADSQITSDEQSRIPSSNLKSDNEDSQNIPPSGTKSTDSQETVEAGKPTQGVTNIPQVLLEQQLNKSKRDLESMVIKYARSESENLQNKNKIDDLDRKLKRAIKDNESLANRIKILTNDKNSITETLNAKLAQLTVLEHKNNSLTNVQTVQSNELKEKCAELEKTNEDLSKQIEMYKTKEGELLEFSERLSMKQMLLQTELDKALENSPDYKVQYEQLKSTHSQLMEYYHDCQERLNKSTTELEEKEKTNIRLSQELNDLDLRHRKRIDELENEMKVMRRKHQIAAKEIYKQMKLINETGNTQEQQLQKTIKS